MVDETTPYATAGAVKDGSVTVTLGGMDANNNDRPAPASVTLELTLTADPGNEDISFPLDRSSVMAKALFTDMQGGDDNFEDAFTDYVTVFNIRPAQCELLFPVVTVKPGRNMWEYGNLRHQPGVYGRDGCRRADFHLLPDGGRPCDV